MYLCHGRILYCMINLRFSPNRSLDWYVRINLKRFNMPIYAVAVGRKIGIYDTYKECQLQVLNYPNAKFKKFDKVEDAEAFIKQFSGISLAKGCASVSSMNQTSKENVNKPELIKLEKISPKSELFSIVNRLGIIEEKLTKFISDTTTTLENLTSRVKNLEGRRDISSVSHSDINNAPPPKKPKTDNVPLVNGLLVNSDGFTLVYTDGACSKNGKMGAQAGIGVWFSDDHHLNISAPVQGPATNNNAEIQAARVAITQAYHAGIRKLSIHTDSKFVINCITQWIHKWKKNNWQLASGGPVKNKDELVKLDNALQLLEAVEWNYVAGHKGIRGNEMADKLAREGASKYKTNITYSTNADLATVKFYEPQSDDEDFNDL